MFYPSSLIFTEKTIYTFYSFIFTYPFQSTPQSCDFIPSSFKTSQFPTYKFVWYVVIFSFQKTWTPPVILFHTTPPPPPLKQKQERQIKEKSRKILGSFGATYQVLLFNSDFYYAACAIDHFRMSKRTRTLEEYCQQNKYCLGFGCPLEGESLFRLYENILTNDKRSTLG